MKKDTEILQGTWSVTALEIDGQTMPASSARIVLKGYRFTTSGMGANYEGTVAIDAEKNPKTFDMTFTTGPEKGKTNLGIFEVEGDTWRLCLDMTGKSRPKEFASRAGVALETLRRVSATAKNKTVPVTPFAVVPAPELEGEWAMEACTISGEALPAAHVKYGKRVAKNNEIMVTMNGQVMVKARFTVGREQQPHTIDYLLASGELQHGIYDLAGKKLKVIFSAPGQPRPADFSTAKGDGKALTVWRLIKQ